ncbi:hypothetical protein IM687_13820 [Stutzerimonas stutzeri]|uniref:phage tail tube protein n=1 Tax=Stutzerimonas stutzeri TaxID=316 RepID=UPI0018AC32B9|nr:phage tail tube protein [Stutzerimonas stutzeri]QPI08273.1 hypothetical protein IM687_13820 [Stutzerimonas stutzeri]
MPVNTAAGARLSIGTKTPATDATSYAADTYVEVGEIENLGEFGDQVSAATFTALADRRVRKFKGTYDAGDMTLTLGFDSGDDGQNALNAALKDAGSDDYNFKVELEDGDVFYFGGKVMSRRIATGAAADIVKANVSIAINTAVIEVPAP